MHPLVCAYPRDLTDRVTELLATACPSNDDRDFFNLCMLAARAKGMTWIDGLHYVILCRSGIN